MHFRDRRHAGDLLARALIHYKGRDDVVVLALPRGGVPVAFEVADALDAPLDVFIVRKIGVPGYEELAMGAIASGGTVVKNGEVIEALRITEQEFAAVVADERAEIGRREIAYRGDTPPLDVKDKIVLLIDDGLATGSSMKAATEAIYQRRPSRLVAAVPVAPPETCAELRDLVDEMICFTTPSPFFAIGAFYFDFSQTSDDEVTALLAAARLNRASRARNAATGARAAPPSVDTHSGEVHIKADGSACAATLTVPPEPRGLILFAHGSGSSRHSPRNRAVAEVLQRARFATLLADLLTTDEESVDDVTAYLRFDIPFLAQRLGHVMDWLAEQDGLAQLPLGLFGASTGAGAALAAAAARPERVRAVVSRGGRPDLAGRRLALVRCPTLLIVGGWDRDVIDLNNDALADLNSAATKELVIVPHATHLFEEPGALEQVAAHARAWFERFVAHAGEAPVHAPLT